MFIRRFKPGIQLSKQQQPPPTNQPTNKIPEFPRKTPKRETNLPLCVGAPLTSKCWKLFLHHSNCELVKPSRSARASIMKVTTDKSKVLATPDLRTTDVWSAFFFLGHLSSDCCFWYNWFICNWYHIHVPVLVLSWFFDYIYFWHRYWPLL